MKHSEHLSCDVRISAMRTEPPQAVLSLTVCFLVEIGDQMSVIARISGPVRLEVDERDMTYGLLDRIMELCKRIIRFPTFDASLPFLSKLGLTEIEVVDASLVELCCSEPVKVALYASRDLSGAFDEIKFLVKRQRESYGGSA